MCIIETFSGSYIKHKSFLYYYLVHKMYDVTPIRFKYNCQILFEWLIVILFFSIVLQFIGVIMGQYWINLLRAL